MNKKIKWLLTVGIVSFILSIVMSITSEGIIPRVNMIVGILIILLFIFISVLFDMIGVAITAQDETPFHSMASKKIKGSAHSVKLLKNSDKLASICNDVIGDVCGVVSGVLVANTISDYFVINKSIVVLIVTGLIASITITGKAYGKTVAINNSKSITEKVGKVLHKFQK